MSDVLDLRAVNAALSFGPCAEVRVGEHAIRYVRSGSGPCVMLLGAADEANPLWAPLVDALAGGHRIVIPQPPSENVDATAWLRYFIEGLGLSSSVLITGPTLASAALDLANADDIAVRKVVVIGNDHSTAETASSRILWIDPNRPVADALRRVYAFLEATPESN